jgi:hypothetical protein
MAMRTAQELRKKMLGRSEQKKPLEGVCFVTDVAYDWPHFEAQQLISVYPRFHLLATSLDMLHAAAEFLQTPRQSYFMWGKDIPYYLITTYRRECAIEAGAELVNVMHEGKKTERWQTLYKTLRGLYAELRAEHQASLQKRLGGAENASQ